MIGIIKGDVRYTHLSQLLNDSILSDKLVDFIGIDRLILPFGGIDNNNIIKGTNINILDIIKSNCIKYIITGNANAVLINICNEYKIDLYELLKDDVFVSDNAFLTAKGLLYLIHEKDTEISDLKVLILGYGNIGFHLCKLLKAIDSSFDVYTANKLEAKYARLEGYNVIENVNEKYDIIINTIPNIVPIDCSYLVGSRVIDVASFPYGFNIDDVIKNNIKYEIISAIPSKYASYSAAKIIKNFMENIENNENIVYN
ncbi:MAG: hypothetical protein E7176_02195 [Erysipelotrichaceae bacterium]|nr:hypothetical protein [Erysipelotrichaceae bacterium]